MKTLFLFSHVGYDLPEFFELEGDFSHLDGYSASRIV